VSSYAVEDVQREPVVVSELPAITEPAFSESGKEEDEMEEQIAQLKQQLAAKEAEFAEQASALKASQADLEKERAGTRKAGFSAFAEGLVKEGRLTPAQRTFAEDFAELAYEFGEYEFAEGGAAAADVKFREFLKTLPVQVEFAEVATRDAVGEGDSGVDAFQEYSGAPVDSERLELRNQAKAMSKKDGIPFVDALNKVMKKEA